MSPPLASTAPALLGAQALLPVAESPPTIAEFKLRGRVLFERLGEGRSRRADFRLNLDRQACTYLMAFLSHLEMAGRHRDVRQPVRSSVPAANPVSLSPAELNLFYSPTYEAGMWSVRDRLSEVDIAMGVERVTTFKDSVVQLYLTAERQLLGRAGHQVELAPLHED